MKEPLIKAQVDRPRQQGATQHREPGAHRPAVATFLLILGVLLSGCTDDSTTSGPPDTPVTEDYTMVNPALEYDLLEPGRYALTPIGPNAGPLAVFDVPDSFASSGPFLSFAGKHRVDECCIVGYWTVTEVYKDPCTQAGGATDPGPSVEDLVRALTGQLLTTTTKPTPVSLGGYAGVYLELTAPARLDLATCTHKTIDFWESAPAGTRYHGNSGAVDRLWILDVGGARVVLDVGVAPGVGEKEIQELTDIVESARFVQE